MPRRRRSTDGRPPREPPAAGLTAPPGVALEPRSASPLDACSKTWYPGSEGPIDQRSDRSDRLSAGSDGGATIALGSGLRPESAFFGESPSDFPAWRRPDLARPGTYGRADLLLLRLYRSRYRSGFPPPWPLHDPGADRLREEGRRMSVRRQKSQRPLMPGRCPPGGGPDRRQRPRWRPPTEQRRREAGRTGPVTRDS